MAKINKSTAPYYDDFDSTKQYYQLLALPGRVAQAREITQMQSVMLDVIKNIGNIFLKNGSITEGCPVIVSNDRKSVTVGSGKVYLEGVVLPVNETTVTISGTGTEKVGIKLVEILIDESSDETLRDPAQGYDNYDQPGAHRLQRIARVVANDDDSATISTLHEGVPVTEGNKPDFDGVERTLARRTHDESGSYLVEGLKVRVEANNSEFFNTVIEAGKAYVLGYELRKPGAVRLPTPKSKVSNTVTASNYIYLTSQSLYMLDSQPFVKDILEVKGTAVFSENQSLSTNVDAVLLTQIDAIRITRVSQGGTIYQIGSGPTSGDCYLMRSGSRYYVKWNGESAPIGGQSYIIEYEYAKEFIKGTDYKLSLTTGSHYLEWLSGGIKPLNNTNLTISYQQYLARKDVVYMDQYGEVFITQGTPTESGFETVPAVPVNTLALAVIHNPPNGDAGDDSSAHDIHVENVGLTRYTMQDISSLVGRVRRNEYDQALLALNDDARQRDTGSTKKGIITDPIVDLSKVDITYNKKADGTPLNSNLPIFDVAMNFTTSSISLPIKNNIYPVDIDVVRSNVKKYDRLVGLPVSGEKVSLTQDAATQSFLVNPYSMFPQLPEVSISPAVDSWIEIDIIKVPKSLTTSSVVSTTTRNIDQLTVARWGSDGSVLGSSSSDSVVGSTVTSRTFSELLREETITYCRNVLITVKGDKFAANLDKIECRFDGKLVDLVPIQGSLAGTKTSVNTVRSDSSGKFQATFRIPSGVLSGIREVQLSSTVNIAGHINSGFTIFQSHGIKRSIRETTETLTTVLLRRTVTNTIQRSYDPVAQTFILDKSTLIKGVDVYFEAKSESTPVSMEIREVLNGTVTNTILGSVTLSAQQVNVSSNSTTATRFNFPDPILLNDNTEYAFVVRSASDRYRIWVAELGEKDVRTNIIVIKNPYLDGVMLSSSNNTTWTPHQTMDIKFRIIEDVYSEKGTLHFGLVNTAQASRLILAADYAIPVGCDVRWYYQLNNDNRWLSCAPYDLMELTTIYNSVEIKAELTRNREVNLSPLVALDTVSIMASIYDILGGSYIGNSVAGVDPYTNVDIIMDTFVPVSSDIKVFISIDGGNVWQTAARDLTSVRNLNNNWRELTFKTTLGTPATKFKLRVDFSTSSAAITPRIAKVRCILS